MATISPYEKVKRAACLPPSTTAGHHGSGRRDNQNPKPARFVVLAQGRIGERCA